MQTAENRSLDSSSKDPRSREQLIMEYLPFVKRILGRIAVHLPPSVDTEDLLNVGVIGLIQAIDRYDPTRDNKFTTYAAFRIRGAMLSELRSRDYLSRTHRKRIRDLEKVYLRLEQQLGREAEDWEVAREMKVELEELHEIRRLSSISFISFDEMGNTSGYDKEKLMNSFLRDGEGALNETGMKELKIGLAEAIEELPEKERLVLSLYYTDELTMKETGEVLGVTESRVSQLHSQAILRLRSKLRRKQLFDG
jgi:RNA polymerase sigma factor for flagellar operon FliA